MSSRKLRRNMMGRSEKGTPSVTEGLQKDPFRHRGATLSLYFSFWIIIPELQKPGPLFLGHCEPQAIFPEHYEPKLISFWGRYPQNIINQGL